MEEDLSFFLSLLAVREIGVSRHNGDPIKVPLKAPQYDSGVIVRGFQGVPQLGTHDAERRYSGQLCTGKTIFPIPFTLNGI